MWWFLLRRVIAGALVAFAVSVIVFLIFFALPAGDPATARIGPGATPEQLEAVRHGLGLDRPLYVQYGLFFRDLFFRADLGYSYQYLMPVRELIWDRLPVTLALVAGATVIGFGAGVGLGVASAARPGSKLDRAAGLGSLAVISAPVFWLGFLVLIVFSAGSSSVLPLLPGIGAWVEAESFLGRIVALILPWLVLGASSAAIYFRFTRGAIAEALDQPYMTAARARGIPERRIRWRYSLRTGIAPLLALAGLDLGLVLAGNVILVETVFNLPGVGRLVADSIEHYDLPLTQGVVLASVGVVVIATIAIDLVHAALDPRVRR